MLCNSGLFPYKGKLSWMPGPLRGSRTDFSIWACHVYAVDVGRCQMHPKFRTDFRVTVMETTNILEVDSLDPPPAGAVCDLSFRSLRGAARHILDLTTEHWLLALAKPQFEWEDPSPDFDGIVRSEENIQRILPSLIESLEKEGVKTRKVLVSSKGQIWEPGILFLPRQFRCLRGLNCRYETIGFSLCTRIVSAKPSGARLSRYRFSDVHPFRA
jgi:hypothetical protein